MSGLLNETTHIVHCDGVIDPEYNSCFCEYIECWTEDVILHDGTIHRLNLSETIRLSVEEGGGEIVHLTDDQGGYIYKDPQKIPIEVRVLLIQRGILDHYEVDYILSKEEYDRLPDEFKASFLYTLLGA